MTRTIRAGVMALGASLLLAVPGPAGGAPNPEPSFHYIPYTIKQDACGMNPPIPTQYLVDPITVFFTHAAAGREVRHAFGLVARETEWPDAYGDDAGQWFFNLDRSICVKTQLQLANHGISYNGQRFHIRFGEMVAEFFAPPDPRYGYVVAATPHREKLENCGGFNFTHIVDPIRGKSDQGGFVKGRREIVKEFNGYAMFDFREGNTRRISQCGGYDDKGSDGLIAFIDISQVPD